MHVTRSMDYALRSLVYLAIHQAGDLARIAEHQHIPPSYLAKVMNRLARSGIVRSFIGREGGYVLKKKPAALSMLEIMEAVEGPLNLYDCFMGTEECFFLEKRCSQRRYWDFLESEIYTILKRTTLADILPGACVLEEMHVEQATRGS